jgi:hypothetical protein
MASLPIYQFYAELDEYKPKIWRRFQVSNNISMARLGYILMTMFEMKASHLFCFDVPYRDNIMRSLAKRYEARGMTINADDEVIHSIDKNYRVEIFDEYTDEYCFDSPETTQVDAVKRTVKSVVSDAADLMVFNYDFGDNWNISITLEKIFEDKELPGKDLPMVLDGAGFGIIEDIGGVYGLLEFAKACKNKSGKKYKELSEWYGIYDMDLASFNIDDINFRLKKIPRIFTDLYEYDLVPTKRSLDLLDRKYIKK